MAKNKEELEVQKESNEIGLALKRLVLTYQKAMEDGFQAGEDIPTVLMGSYKEISEAIDGAGKLKAEFKENPAEAIMGFLVPISEAVEEILGRNKPGEVKAAPVGGEFKKDEEPSKK